MAQSGQGKKQDHFEKKMQELEKIVQSLEGGELPLDQTLKKFEQGVSLYKDCKKVLSKAQVKIKELTDSLEEEDFGP